MQTLPPPCGGAAELPAFLDTASFNHPALGPPVGGAPASRLPAETQQHTGVSQRVAALFKRAESFVPERPLISRRVHGTLWLKQTAAMKSSRSSSLMTNTVGSDETHSAVTLDVRRTTAGIKHKHQVKLSYPADIHSSLFPNIMLLLQLLWFLFSPVRHRARLCPG